MSADKVQEAIYATTAAIARSFNAAAKEGAGFVDLAPEFDSLIAAVREDEKARCVEAVKALPGRVIPTHADLFEVTEAIRNA